MKASTELLKRNALCKKCKVNIPQGDYGVVFREPRKKAMFFHNGCFNKIVREARS